MAESFDHESADGSILVGLRKLEAETLVEFRNRRASDHREHARTDYSRVIFAADAFFSDITTDRFAPIFHIESNRSAGGFDSGNEHTHPSALHPEQRTSES